MGNAVLTVCGKGLELATNAAAPDQNDAEGEAPIHSGTQVHMLILALDYPGTGNELTCTQDGNNMQELAQQCGVTDIVALYNNQAHKEAVMQAISEVGSRCQDGDYFILNYSGHGTSVPDKDGDEEDGQDEALCLVTPSGQIDWNAFMTDDEVADCITEAVQADAKILLMCDCCHSGTIGDFQSSADTWAGKTALSMSGCSDDQTSGDTGKGGIWTHALLMAVQEMQEEGTDDYSVAQLYNKQLEKDDEVFNSKQDLQLKWSQELGSCTKMAWPLIPGPGYVAPWNR